MRVDDSKIAYHNTRPPNGRNRNLSGHHQSASRTRGALVQRLADEASSGDEIDMDLASILAAVKSVIVEGTGLSSLVLAGVAFILIEFWGIKKIWRLMNKPDD
jgi:hypothetical protein